MNDATLFSSTHVCVCVCASAMFVYFVVVLSRFWMRAIFGAIHPEYGLERDFLSLSFL